MTESLNLGSSLLVTLVGMAIVFLGLVILIFLIKALVKVTENKKKQQTPAPAPVQAAPSVGASEETEETDDLELVAVISAALSVVLEKQPSGFVVRHIRRIPPAWRS